MSQQARAERIALNEARFRQINDRVRDDLAHLRGRDVPLVLVCECGRIDCREQLELTDAEYRRLRADAMQFAVVPGHEIPETEEVVQLAGGFAVVRKYENVRHVVDPPPA